MWKHQINLILEGYGMTGFILGTMPVPAKLIPRIDGKLIENKFLVYRKQDKFLASWLCQQF